ncbi:MAG TPA: acetate kinase, partial [Gemmatimonadales bacterium]|nr:acetate kinase [Gemmatimonadales bacterium]
MPGKRASLPQSGPRHVLVVNCGSATLKYKLFAAADGETLHPIAAATLPIAAADPAALATLVDSLPRRPDVVAHRVVYGDEQFNELAVIDDQVLSELEALAELAPLHHERATVLIRAAAGLGLPQVAAFDSAFHRTMPAVARRYALPPLEGVQRHGFHGWSHRFAVEEYARLTGHADPTLVTLHLGGGCSAAAIRHGRSVDTSMGFTPLEGLVMGTRAGDLDPGLLLHLLRTGFTADQLEDLLQHHSGLRGLAGTSDMRELLRRHDAEAVLAVDVFCHRVRKYVGAYLAVLEGAEAIV